MDSLTQAALGAAVAAAVWQRQLGRSALLWGVGLGTLPDLDVAVNPWLDTAEGLRWHRGVSHSLLVLPVVALLAAAAVRACHRARGVTWTRAWVGAWLVLVTHVGIDWLTVYGTQLLAPVSRRGFGADVLFIIDPLYTVPLLIGLAGACWARDPERRRRWNAAGLLVSTLYVGWAFAAQAWTAGAFERELARQGIAPTGRAITSPTAFNTVLWRHLAPVEGGFVIGYRSLLDRGLEIRFDFVARGEERVSGLRETREFAVLEWFSQGFWVTAEGEAGVVRVSDLRFGELRAAPDAPPEEWRYIFTWELHRHADGAVELRSFPQDFEERGATLGALWRRLRGHGDAL